MSKFENLFNILPDGALEINKPELRQHTMLKAVVGLGKSVGLKNLMYIYLISDPRSMYYHLEEEEKIKQARKHLGFGDEYTIPVVTNAAIDSYKELIALSPTGKAFTTANKALFEIGNDLEYILDSTVYFKKLLKDRIAALKDKDKEDKIILNEIDECKALINGILENATQINKQINELPKMNKTVEELATKWANEGNGTKEVYGGGSVGNRE